MSPGKRLFSDCGAVGGGVWDSPVLTPSSVNVEQEHDDDSDLELVTMKPQSLAATFDYFSDEDL